MHTGTEYILLTHAWQLFRLGKIKHFHCVIDQNKHRYYKYNTETLSSISTFDAPIGIYRRQRRTKHNQTKYVNRMFTHMCTQKILVMHIYAYAAADVMPNLTVCATVKPI